MISDLQKQLRTELDRIGAQQTELRFDEEFAPEVGELVHVKVDEAEWRFLPGRFRDLLGDIPTGAGDEGVRRHIESHADFVWHGEEPKGSYDSPEPPQ